MENILKLTELKLIILSVIAITTYLITLKNKKLTKHEAKTALFLFINFIICLAVMFYLQNFFNSTHVFTSITIIFSVISLIILKLLKTNNNYLTTLFTSIIIGSILLGYNLYTPFHSRQHDCRNFGYPEHGGHFGYIGYIYTYHTLPVGSPADTWCFYNPPLFYIISTIILKITTFLKGSLELGFENLQIFAMMYTIVFDVYVYRILKEFNIKKSIIPTILFVALSPAMVIMSGSINNDILSITLATMAIYYTLIWYKKDDLKTLLKIALTIGLSIMTKISTALIAVAIAIVFLKKVIENKKDFFKYVKHFSIFALIALPIGLWFPIKNLVLYDIPFTYVQSVDESNDANVSKYSTLERFFKINKGHLSNINIDMSKENAEYNLYTTTLKSFIIDEYIEYHESKLASFSITYMFYLCIMISIIYLINIFYVLKNRKELCNNWLYFFIIIGILQIGSYISFCFNFPFTFTMNFRYIVPTLITYAVITSTASEANKRLLHINTTLNIIFAITSIIMFTNIF